MGKLAKMIPTGSIRQLFDFLQSARGQKMIKVVILSDFVVVGNLITLSEEESGRIRAEDKAIKIAED